MIVCRTCGEHNAPNTEFCGNCGDFLKWTGAEVGPVRPDSDQPTTTHHSPQRTAKRLPQPGDLICGQCGSGNVPTRRFCGVCGYTLVDAEIQKQPWWKRWLPKKGPKVRERGSRPRRAPRVRQGIGRAFRWALAVAVLLFGGLYGCSPPFRQNVNAQVVSTKDTVVGIFDQRVVPVRQSSISSNAERPEHPAKLAMDNDPATFWAAQTEPKTTALTIQFDHEVDLRRALVRIGDPNKYLGAARPRRLHLVFDTGKTAVIQLTDVPDPQEVKISDGDGITQVQVLVAEVFPSTESTDTVIAEIELFEKQVK